jgi:hypothetical protein
MIEDTLVRNDNSMSTDMIEDTLVRNDNSMSTDMIEDTLQVPDKLYLVHD